MLHIIANRSRYFNCKLFPLKSKCGPPSFKNYNQTARSRALIRIITVCEDPDTHLWISLQGSFNLKCYCQKITTVELKWGTSYVTYCVCSPSNRQRHRLRRLSLEKYLFTKGTHFHRRETKVRSLMAQAGIRNNKANNFA